MCVWLHGHTDPPLIKMWLIIVYYFYYYCCIVLVMFVTYDGIHSGLYDFMDVFE